MNQEDLLNDDLAHVWHPYTHCFDSVSNHLIKSAQGCTLTTGDDTTLIDAMSSWWCMIHGYNHPVLNEAAKAQLDDMSHVMFGGLTHKPAIALAKTLTQIVPKGLNKVFFSDSGSVAVEVAMKMAIQYWIGKKCPQKNRFISFRNGYHGDTFAAMSVCDPITGMHHLFSNVLQQQIFAPSPESIFGNTNNAIIEQDIAGFETLLKSHAQQTAAVIIEPIVQGTGGMRFYSPKFLLQVKKLCEQYGVLFIADEIATGFGRSGKLFACEYANITPDIMCIGKAMTGGYISLAATLCTNKVAESVCATEAGVFMHGPTFMANPLACALSLASINLLLKDSWQSRVANIEQQLKTHLLPSQELDSVKDVRVLGAIGVIEMHNPIDLKEATPYFVEQGVWLRPFGKLLYTMPPFIINEQELEKICKVMRGYAMRR